MQIAVSFVFRKPCRQSGETDSPADGFDGRPIKPFCPRCAGRTTCIPGAENPGTEVVRPPCPGSSIFHKMEDLLRVCRTNYYRLDEKLQYENGRKDIHSPRQFLHVSTNQVNQHITDHSQYDTVRDAVCQRHEHDAHKCRNGL